MVLCLILASVFIALTKTTHAQTSPCAGGQESGLPLPSGFLPSRLPEFQAQLKTFLTGGKYKTLKWCEDKKLRDTGPFVNGVSYGVHPTVKIYYSPAIINWLLKRASGQAIPDGSMIVKEQYTAPAARYQLGPPKGINGWTIMIKDSKGSADGWYWAEMWDAQCVDNNKPPFAVPYAGFGLYCVRCHASVMNVSPFGEWRWSPMGLAGRDPVFYAQLESEIEFVKSFFKNDPAKVAEKIKQINNTCFKCHGVMGKRRLDDDHGGTDKGNFESELVYATYDSSPPANDKYIYGALVRDGVSCMACHRIIEDNPSKPDADPFVNFLKTKITGNFTTGNPTELFGPFEDKEIVTDPMNNSLGIKPERLPSELFDVYTDGTKPATLDYPTPCLKVTPQHYQRHFFWDPQKNTGSAITRQDQVQIYEELNLNIDCVMTTSFLRRDYQLKDNRLLPYGWTSTGPLKADKTPYIPAEYLHETHPVKVGGDPSYADGSGTNILRYEIPLNAFTAKNVSVSATLYYQSIPPYFLNDRFTQAPNGPATQRLYYLTSNLQTKGTAIENWKVLITSASQETTVR